MSTPGTPPSRTREPASLLPCRRGRPPPSSCDPFRRPSRPRRTGPSWRLSLAPSPSVPPASMAAPPPRSRRAAVVQARGQERADDAASSGFVERHTSPFGIHHVAATPGEVPVICVTSPKGGSGKTTGRAQPRRGVRPSGQPRPPRRHRLQRRAHGHPRPSPARLSRRACDVVAGKASLRRRHPQDPSCPAFKSSRGGEGAEDCTRPRGAPGSGPLPDREGGRRHRPRRHCRPAFNGPKCALACAAATHALVVLAAEPAGLRSLEGLSARASHRSPRNRP